MNPSIMISGVAERKGSLKRRCGVGCRDYGIITSRRKRNQRFRRLREHCIINSVFLKKYGRPRPRLLRRKTAHAVFYREKRKFYNRIC